MPMMTRGSMTSTLADDQGSVHRLPRPHLFKHHENIDVVYVLLAGRSSVRLPWRLARSRQAVRSTP